MKKILIASVIALALALGVTSTAQAAFNADLTIGSTGQDVVNLQSWLVAQGHLVMPAGVAYGYFGQLTKAAVTKYQAQVGLPNTGYFGPMTRAKLNGTSGTAVGCPAGLICTPISTTVACPVGFVCTPVAGGSTGSTGTITTPGVEGSIVVDKESSGIQSTVYEGDTMVPVLGVRVEAKDSDVSVGRIKIGLGTTTDAYVKVFRKIYLTDASGTILAEKDLNSSTVTRDSSASPAQYYITLTGFNYIVSKNTKKSLYVKLDAYGSVDSTYRRSWTIGLYGTNDAVRVTDGAGLDQYAGGSTQGGTNGSFSAGTYQSFTVSASLSDSATLTVSTDPNLMKATTIVADQGSADNESDKQTLGSFRVLAEKDGVLIRDLSVNVTTVTDGDATLQTAYLFDGSTQIASAGVTQIGSTASSTFTSIDYRIDRDVTKTLTIKYDIRDAGTTASVFKVSQIVVGSAESTGTGRTLTVSNLNTVGENMTIVSKGVVTSLDSTPSIDITSTEDQNGSTTAAHLTAVFNVRIKAVGSDIAFGTPASAFRFTLLKNGTAQGAPMVAQASSATSTFYPATQPTGTTGYTGGTSGAFTVPRNAEVVIPVTLKVDTAAGTSVDLASGASYAVRLSSIVYGVSPATTGITTDYSGNSAWVTAGDSI